MKLQKLGGYAALGSLVIIFIQRVFTKPVGYEYVRDPVKAMNAYSAAPVGFLAYCFLGIVWPLLLAILYFALYERMHAKAPSLTRLMLFALSISISMLIVPAIVWSTTVNSIVQAQDASAFRTMEAVAMGLNSTGNFASGLLFLVVGFAILKTETLSKIPGWLYFMGGILFIPTSFINPANPIVNARHLLPTLAVIWICTALLRDKQPQP
jgi:hypothetical protein